MFNEKHTPTDTSGLLKGHQRKTRRSNLFGFGRPVLHDQSFVDQHLAWPKRWFSICFSRPLRTKMAAAQQTGTQNGSLVSGNMDQNLRNPPCLILSHSQMRKYLNQEREIWYIVLRKWKQRLLFDLICFPGQNEEICVVVILKPKMKKDTS